MKSISVAGNPVSDPLKVISNYIDQRERTIRRFDLMAGTSPYELTPQLIKASRALSSRITKEEEAWLLQIQGDAPWERVSPTDSLIDAEVCSSNGLYDEATALWEYFWNLRPPGVANAKLSKVLFLMRPECFPIVDTHVTNRYRTEARALQPIVYAARPELIGKDNLTWEAYRRDLVRAQAQLAVVRTELLSGGSSIQQEVARRVTDLRLFDMLVW